MAEERNCREEGHNLEEVRRTVGYQCKFCDYYISEDSIHRYGLGRCPRCVAPKEKIEVNFSGSEYLSYKCNNCGHSWRELM